MPTKWTEPVVGVVGTSPTPEALTCLPVEIDYEEPGVWEGADGPSNNPAEGLLPPKWRSVDFPA